MGKNLKENQANILQNSKSAKSKSKDSIDDIFGTIQKVDTTAALPHKSTTQDVKSVKTSRVEKQSREPAKKGDVSETLFTDLRGHGSRKEISIEMEAH